MYEKIEKMIKDLELRGRSKHTIKNMVCTIESFSRFYNQPPELLGEQQIINYLDYCINTKNLCRGTVNSINSALKFFFVVTLERGWSDLRISDIMSKEMKLRVRCGKRNKERYTLLSEKNLLLLREYWRKFGRKHSLPMIIYLFQGKLVNR